MTQKMTSLQQLREALEALHQALEGVESALIEFEEEALAEGESGEQEKAQQRSQSSATAFELLSIPEVCQELGMGKSWVYKQIKSAQIPSVKLGHNIKVKREDLEQYLESQRYHPSENQQG